MCFRGDALSCRASPLPKQSTGLFWNSPLAERTMYEDFALCGERRGRRPRPASFFYEKKLDQKTCLLSGFESLHRTLNFVLSEQTNNKIMPRSNLICFGAKLLYQHRRYLRACLFIKGTVPILSAHPRLRLMRNACLQAPLHLCQRPTAYALRWNLSRCCRR